ncbi:MAG: hypothetical protein HY654_02140, partial [Acidobacteria bacterium]|nr:hypothetical protein [Acidobacteriota bacterium]
TLDGIDTNESSAGGSNFSPLRTNPDSLVEFKVITSNFTAEYGRNSGGQVAMITRSGTNDLRGTGFYFLRRPELNANEWENNINGLPKQQFVQDIAGFSLGGPIRRGRTFFFGNLQVLRADVTRVVTRTVLTEQARQGIWRYVRNARNQPAGVAGASVDASGNPLPGLAIGTYNIPASDPQGLGLDPTIQATLAKTPLPNNFTTGDGLNLAGFTFVAPEQEHQYDSVIKIDHVLTSRHYLFVRPAWGRQNTNCDSVNGGQPRFPDGSCIVNTKRDPYNVAANWRWNPGSSVVNEMVAGVNPFAFDFVIPTADPSKPTFSAVGLTMPEEFTVGNSRAIDTWQFVDNVSWFKGAHALKFGTNIRLQRHTDVRGSVAGANVAPAVNFSTAVNTVDPTTFRLPADINIAFDRPALQNNVNFLLGRVGSISQGFVQRGDQYGPGGTLFEFAAWFRELDFFAQDNWKPRPNVTVDLGLRWELKMAPTNPDDLIRRPNQRVAVGADPSRTLQWEQGALYDNDVNNIGPAIGIAWDPGNNGKSVVRGNYRIAYDRINTFLLSSAIFQSIPGITTSVVNTAFGQAGGRLRNLPALQPTTKPADFLQPPAPSNSTIRVVDPEFQSPRTHGWAIGYQREIWKNTAVQATYIGRRADHLFGAYDAHQVEIRKNGFLEAFNVVRAGGQSPLMNQLLAGDTRRRADETGSDMVRRLFASSLTLGSLAAVAQDFARRVQGGRTLTEIAGLSPYFFVPYPQFLNGVTVIDSNDYSRYHALELAIDRRFRDGYSYTFAYTWSRSKDTRSFDPAFTVVSTANAQSASSTPFDIFDRDLNYSLSDFDRTHVMQGNFVFELPFGEGKRWGRNGGGLANQFIGGWQISGAFTIQTGRPFTIYSGSNTFSNIVQTPANCNNCSGSEGGVFDDPETGLVWYLSREERALFSTPGAGEFSNVGRNFFRGDGGYNLNLGLTKRFRLFRNQTLEYRLEATNVTNIPTFGFPTATTTSTIFGRIRDSVTSQARQVQMGLKYTF